METTKQVLLKLSGESLAKSKEGREFLEETLKEAKKAQAMMRQKEYANFQRSISNLYQEAGINYKTAMSIASQIAVLNNESNNVNVKTIVIGGGNLLRGREVSGMDREEADNIGMLGTVMNGIALTAALNENGVDAILQTPFAIAGISNVYLHSDIKKFLKKGKVVVFGGGTGQSRFSTDTNAALRAAQYGQDFIFKASTIDGVYNDDPNKNKDAQRYQTLSFATAIKDELEVLDPEAFIKCRRSNIPIIVARSEELSNLPSCLYESQKIGTYVGDVEDKFYLTRKK